MLFIYSIYASSTVCSFHYSAHHHFSFVPYNITGKRYMSGVTPFFNSPYFFRTSQGLVFRAQFRDFKCQTFNIHEDSEVIKFLEMHFDKDISIGPTLKIEKFLHLLKQFDKSINLSDPDTPLTFKNISGDIVGFSWISRIPILRTGKLNFYWDKHHSKNMKDFLYFMINIYAPEIRRLGHMFPDFKLFEGETNLERIFAMIHPNEKEVIAIFDELGMHSFLFIFFFRRA